MDEEISSNKQEECLLFELFFASGTLTANGFEGRDEVEDPLDELLMEAGLGEVTGGGGGVRGSNIDIVLSAQRLEEGIRAVAHFLQENNLLQQTKLTQRDPETRIIDLHKYTEAVSD